MMASPRGLNLRPGARGGSGGRGMILIERERCGSAHNGARFCPRPCWPAHRYTLECSPPPGQATGSAGPQACARVGAGECAPWCRPCGREHRSFEKKRLAPLCILPVDQGLGVAFARVLLAVLRLVEAELSGSGGQHQLQLDDAFARLGERVPLDVQVVFDAHDCTLVWRTTSSTNSSTTSCA